MRYRVLETRRGLDLQARIQGSKPCYKTKTRKMTVLHQTLEVRVGAPSNRPRAGRCRGRVAANVASPESAVKDFDHEVSARCAARADVFRARCQR